MARLTEEMVVARTKQSDIGQVTKLNCWGSELSDVRLLRRMQNVEVLSLSVNKIRSLEDFQHCRNLVELFVRKNEIADLNQILYLQSLPKLRNLWLEENPCANEEDYRYTVLRALPGLKTLDKIPVLPEEVQDAMRRGRELLNPQDQEYWEQPPQPDSRDCSPPPAAPTAYQRVEQQGAQQQQQSQQQQQQSQQQQQQQQATLPQERPQQPLPEPSTPAGAGSDEPHRGLNDDTTPAPTRPNPTSTSNSFPTSTPTSSSRRTPLSSSPPQPQPAVQQGSPVGQRSPPRCAADTQSATFTRKPSRDYIIRNADDVPVGGGGQYYYEDGELQYKQHQALTPAQQVYEDPPVEEEPPVILRQSNRFSNGGYHDPHGPLNQGDNSSSDGSGGIYRDRSRPVSTVEDESRQTHDRNNRQTHERLSSAAQRLANDRMICNANQRAPYPRRPITRSSNLLSAVLCLVKELDYPSLEVVEMAVKCRMDELED